MLRRCLLLLTAMLIMVTPILADGNFEIETKGIGAGDSGSYSEYGFYDFFEYGRWITRDEGVTLELMPKSSIMKSLASDGYAVDAAWRLVKARFSSDRHWDNEIVMRMQFNCHVALAGFWKTPWRIEPWKRTMNWKCN